MFELPVSYFQKENNISKGIERIIIDMTKAKILKDNIDNDLWQKLVLAITYIKNS